MRLYTFMLFMFIFSMTQSLITEMGIFPDGTTGSTINASQVGVDAELLTTNMIEVSGDVDTGIGGITAMAGMLSKLVGVLLGTFTFFIYKLAVMLMAVGVPSAIAWMLQTIIFIVMAVGGFQLISGRGMKNYV